MPEYCGTPILAFELRMPLPVFGVHALPLRNRGQVAGEAVQTNVRRFASRRGRQARRDASMGALFRSSSQNFCANQGARVTCFSSTRKTSQDIPALKREQLGTGARGKYFQQYANDSNVAVLKPEIQKAFPTSEVVNKALASMLAFSEDTQRLAARPVGRATKRRAA